MSKRAEVQVQDQTVRLSQTKLLLLLFGLQVALFCSFIDSTSVSTILPVIADDLGAAASITWAGTAFLIANTSFQIITSRLSDCFGRKIVLLSSVGVFGVGALLAGFAQNKIWLYCARAVAGIGGGGINSLSMIIVSDVVPLRDRGKYLTLLGIGIALGSAAGPFLGAVLAQTASWSWAFWIIPPMAAVTIALVFYTVPQKELEGDVWQKIKTMDWLGSFLSLAMTVCLLVPLSGGGSTFAWSSPTVITLMIVGGLSVLAFIYVEGWVAALPLFPARILRNRNVCLLIVQTWLVGVVFYGGIYFTPLYLQNVRGYDMITSAALLLPLVLTQVFTTMISGYMIKWTGRARTSFSVGFVLWAAGQGAQICFDEDTTLGVIIGCLLLQGLGIGATIQSTLVLAQASGPALDRAAVTGVRNFARTSGGAIGLAIGNAVLQNRYLSSVPDSISPELRTTLQTSFSLPNDLDPALKAAITTAYMSGLRQVFIFFTPVVLICLIMCAFVVDLSLDSPPPAPTPSSSEEQDTGPDDEPAPPSVTTTAAGSEREKSVSDLRAGVAVVPVVSAPVSPAQSRSDRRESEKSTV